jgi:hypothetical protein
MWTESNLSRLVNHAVRIMYVLGVGAWVLIQTGKPTDPAVIYKDLAAIAVGGVSLLFGMGYRDFSRRVDENAKELKALREKHDEHFEHIGRELASMRALVTRELEPPGPEDRGMRY